VFREVKMSICKDCRTEEIILEDGTPCCMGTVRKWEVIHGAFIWKYTQRLTPLAPDPSKAGVLSLPDVVKVENALPAESG
jgi:hypothetical protein